MPYQTVIQFEEVFPNGDVDGLMLYHEKALEDFVVLEAIRRGWDALGVVDEADKSKRVLDLMGYLVREEGWMPDSEPAGTGLQVTVLHVEDDRGFSNT